MKTNHSSENGRQASVNQEILFRTTSEVDLPDKKEETSKPAVNSSYLDDEKKKRKENDQEK